jgi:glycerate dehydrogenase
MVNIRHYAFNTVPEHVFALIFALRRNLIAYREDVSNGAWQRANQFCFFPHPIRDIAGSTLGVIGLADRISNNPENDGNAARQWLECCAKE